MVTQALVVQFATIHSFFCKVVMLAFLNYVHDTDADDLRTSYVNTFFLNHQPGAKSAPDERDILLDAIKELASTTTLTYADILSIIREQYDRSEVAIHGNILGPGNYVTSTITTPLTEQEILEEIHSNGQLYELRHIVAVLKKHADNSALEV